MWLKVELPTTNWPFRLSLESFLLLESSFKEVSLYCFTFLAREKFLWLKIDLFLIKLTVILSGTKKKVIGRFWNLPWGDFTLLGTLLFHYLGYIDIFFVSKKFNGYWVIFVMLSSKDTNGKIRTAFSIDLRCLNFGSKSQEQGVHRCIS